MTASKTLVLGFGNVLMGDDGFGPAVVRAFDRRYDAGPDVEVIDLGTPGLDLTPWLADTGCAIVVDTVNARLAPGCVRVYNKTDLLEHRPAARVSPHDPGLTETLQALELAGRAPRDVMVIGVVPASCAMSLELSDPVKRAVPLAVQVVEVTLEWFGVEVRARRQSLEDVPWWSVPAAHG